MSEILKTPEAQTNEAEGASPQVEKKTPSKRGRMSFIERAQKESEELVKNMGGSLELEGGRRTRSSARGTPSRPAVVTPPPAKKARNSPVSPKSTPRARGRGRKLDTSETPEPPEQPNKEKEIEKLESSEMTVGSKETKEKVEEKPETNGPEKSDEPVHDTSLEVKEDTEVEAQKKELEKPAIKDKDVVDHADISVEIKQDGQKEPEKSLNETREAIKPKESIENEASVDSPMEVDEQSGPQVVVDKPKPDSLKADTEASEKSVETVDPTANIAEKVVDTEKVDKEPTPEPMEVDSSSKSSDVVCTDVVDKAEVSNDAKKVDIKSSADQEEDKSVVSNDPPSIVDKEPQVLKSSLSNSEENGTTGEVNANTISEHGASVAIESELKSVEAPVTNEESKIDNVTESKTENNIDESKLTTPQSNAAGDAAVTTT